MSNPVWSCIYAGAHGVDVSLYKSEADAIYGAVITMLSMLYKVGNPITKGFLLQKVENAQYDEALRLYSAAAQESFEIQSKSVLEVSEKTLTDVLNQNKRKCS